MTPVQYWEEETGGKISQAGLEGDKHAFPNYGVYKKHPNVTHYCAPRLVFYVACELEIPNEEEDPIKLWAIEFSKNSSIDKCWSSAFPKRNFKTVQEIVRSITKEIIGI